MDGLIQDLRYAAWSLIKAPAFTAIAVLLLALGIGVNTAVFTVLDAVVLRPLPYRDADRIVTVATAPREAGSPGMTSRQLSIPNFQDLQDRSRSFQSSAFYISRETSVTSGLAAEYVRAARVSPEFFSVFGVEPIFGRLFTGDETAIGSGGAALISEGYWKSHFNGERTVLGRTIRLYGASVAVVGVLPSTFRFPANTDIWFPADTITTETRQYRGANNYLAVGKLHGGTTLERARAEASRIGDQLSREYGQFNAHQTMTVARMQDDLVKDARPTLYVMFGAVSLILLIACVNVAILLLQRMTVRARDLAIRAALGGSASRLARQILVEMLMLSLLAGSASLVLAVAGTQALIAMAPPDVPRLAEVRVDTTVFLFAFAVSILTSVVCGLLPMMQATRLDLNEILKESRSRSVAGGRSAGVRAALVVAEVALCVMLLAGGGLLVKSFAKLQRVPLGFQPEHVLALKASVPAVSGGDAKRANRFFGDLISSIRTLPGVTAAGATMSPPGHVDAEVSSFADKLPAKLPGGAPDVVLSVVAPGTFETLGIPIKAGRDFRDSDGPDSPFTVVINEALAKKAFPGLDPIGRTLFCLFDSPQGMRVVGVVGNIRQYGRARDPKPECFLPYSQHQYNGATLNVLVRTASEPGSVGAALQRAARQLAPDVPLKLTTMETLLSETQAAATFRTTLAGLLAALGVLLAMFGVYGVMAYTVTQRAGEMGLRIALGATPASVRRLIMTRAMALTGIGLAAGLVLAVVQGRLLTNFLFQVTPGDPAVYAAVGLSVLATTALASYLPARRASRVDAVHVLKG